MWTYDYFEDGQPWHLKDVAREIQRFLDPKGHLQALRRLLIVLSFDESHHLARSEYGKLSVYSCLRDVLHELNDFPMCSLFFVYRRGTERVFER